MAWTSPATWSASQLVTASDLNTQIRDNLLFLAGTTGVMPNIHMTSPTIDNGTLTFAAGSGATVDTSAITGNTAFLGPAGSFLFRNQLNSVTNLQITNAGAVILGVGQLQMNAGWIDFSPQVNGVIYSGTANFIVRDAANANTNFSVTNVGAASIRVSLDAPSFLSAGGGTYSNTGALRLAHATAIGWRNYLNNADVVLGLDATDRFTFSGGMATASTVGTAGGAAAQPATPAAYWQVNIGGTLYKVALHTP